MKGSKRKASAMASSSLPSASATTEVKGGVSWSSSGVASVKDRTVGARESSPSWGPSLSTSCPSPVEQALEKEDILISILHRVSSRTGTFHHALVCRRWLHLSPALQTSVHVAPLSEISEAELIRQIREFPNLTRIRLQQCVPRLTDFFLGALAANFRQLRHLELEGRVYIASDDTTGEGWSSLFTNNPHLKTLSYSGIRKASIIESLTTLTQLQVFKAEEVTSLPACLGNLSTLKKLCIQGNWDSSTSLPESISQLRLLRELSFQSGALVPLPDEIGQLPALKILRLEMYHVVTLPESLARLTQLEVLDIQVCLELIALPHGLGNLWNLRVFRLCCCPRIRFISPALLRAPSEKLDIRACPLLTPLS